MSQTNKTNWSLAIVLFIVIMGLLSSMTGCELKADVTTTDDGILLIEQARRIKVLENGTISYVRITTKTQLDIYKVGDKVWVNLNTHRIDDQDTTAMMAEILSDTGVVRSARDYQLDVHSQKDAILIYDGDRLVGRSTTDSAGLIADVILKDNL